MGCQYETSKYSGVYHLAAEPVHEYPSYTKEGEGGETHTLYRGGPQDGDHGRWMVVDKESRIAGNYSGIKSASAAELPTQEGLQWKVVDELDHAIVCTDCRATTDRLKAMASSTKPNNQVSKVSAR